MAPRRIKLAEVTTREAGEDDGEPLAQFRCSRGRWFEDEVETYLNEKAISQIGSGLDYHLLLCFRGEELIACAGHHLEPVMAAESAEMVPFTRLHVLAVGLAYAGRRLDDGTRLSDAILRAAIQSAREHGRRYPLTAIVANENHRSLAVFERNGRWSQIRYGAAYTRLVGRPELAEA